MNFSQQFGLARAVPGISGIRANFNFSEVWIRVDIIPQLVKSNRRVEILIGEKMFASCSHIGQRQDQPQG